MVLCTFVDSASVLVIEKKDYILPFIDALLALVVPGTYMLIQYLSDAAVAVDSNSDETLLAQTCSNSEK